MESPPRVAAVSELAWWAARGRGKGRNKVRARARGIKRRGEAAAAAQLLPSERPDGRRLIGTDAPRRDVGDEVVLAVHGRARHAPQHHELADVIDGVRDRP